MEGSTVSAFGKSFLDCLKDDFLKKVSWEITSVANNKTKLLQKKNRCNLESALDYQLLSTLAVDPINWWVQSSECRQSLPF